MTLNVEIEDQGSWPDEFLNTVRHNSDLILAYHRREAEIERLRRTDVLARINSPINDQNDEYTSLVRRLDEALVPHSLTGYHCTRLVSEEVHDIRRNGLRVLSPSLADQRLELCRTSGHLSAHDYEYIARNELVAASLSDRHGERAGKIWFCPNRSTLQDPSAVYRLFRSWGGEAIYGGFEHDPKISMILASIGFPCIVRCAIPFARAGQFHSSFAERFLSGFISDDVECPEPPAEFDLYTEQDVAASCVLELIEFTDRKFRLLTNCAGWEESYLIHSESRT